IRTKITSKKYDSIVKGCRYCTWQLYSRTAACLLNNWNLRIYRLSSCWDALCIAAGKHSGDYECHSVSWSVHRSSTCPAYGIYHFIKNDAACRDRQYGLSNSREQYYIPSGCWSNAAPSPAGDNISCASWGPSGRCRGNDSCRANLRFRQGHYSAYVRLLCTSKNNLTAAFDSIFRCSYNLKRCI